MPTKEAVQQQFTKKNIVSELLRNRIKSREQGAPTTVAGTTLPPERRK